MIEVKIQTKKGEEVTEITGRSFVGVVLENDYSVSLLSSIYAPAPMVCEMYVSLLELIEKLENQIPILDDLRNAVVEATSEGAAQ